MIPVSVFIFLATFLILTMGTLGWVPDTVPLVLPWIFASLTSVIPQVPTQQPLSEHSFPQPTTNNHSFTHSLLIQWYSPFLISHCIYFLTHRKNPFSIPKCSDQCWPTVIINKYELFLLPLSIPYPVAKFQKAISEIWQRDLCFPNPQSHTNPCQGRHHQLHPSKLHGEHELCPCPHLCLHHTELPELGVCLPCQEEGGSNRLLLTATGFILVRGRMQPVDGIFTGTWDVLWSFVALDA